MPTRDETQLQEFLLDREPAAMAETAWGRAHIRLRVCSYLDSDIPPARLVTSVRAVVLRSAKVVVLENVDGRHYLPGGRIEAGETFLDALTREIAEECGLQVEDTDLMGFIHLRHVTPKPPHYPYPYPDMIQLVYRACAAGCLRSGDADGYEKAALLMEPERAYGIEGTEFAKPFLHRATGVAPPKHAGGA